MAKLKHKDYLFFEEGYGDILGYSDKHYLDLGANIVSREEALAKDIICDHKIGEGNYLDKVKDGRTIFGFIASVFHGELTDENILTNKLSVLSFEDMVSNGRRVFWKNNELAGEAAILHAFPAYGKLPRDCKVAMLGRGNVAFGAYNILKSLGADVIVYNRDNVKYLIDDIDQYDVIVNALVWDTSTGKYLINKKDLKKMKPNSIIIDVSCDIPGAIETSKTTTLHDPIYVVDGVMHYVVDYTPSVFPFSASINISKALSPFIDSIVEDKIQENEVLKNCLVVEKGEITPKFK